MDKITLIKPAFASISINIRSCPCCMLLANRQPAFARNGLPLWHRVEQMIDGNPDWASVR